MSNEANISNSELPELKGKRILITGGLGFIGSNLAHKCLELGAQVTILDILDPRSGGNIYNVHDIQDHVELCFHDITDFNQVSQQVIKKDIIYNCAASTSHPFSMKEPWIDLDVNSKGVINLLEAIRRFNRDVKFIHLGTSTQLGTLRYQPADEKHPEFPTDIYSANKCVSEKYTLIYAKAHQIKSTVIRLSNVFGPRACINSSDFTFNNYFVGLALQDKEITVFGDGRQMRNTIYVDDVVDALILLSQSSEINQETYFVVGDNHYSVSQIAEETVKYLRKGKVKYVDWPKDRKAVDFGDAIISNKKFKEALNWVPKHDLKSGLIKTKEYYAECLEEYLR